MLCTSPVIIINPTLVTSLCKYNSYHTPSGDIHLNYSTRIKWSNGFPFALFSVRKNGITVDTIDEYYFFNSNTGSICPIYIQVPCGKCILCRNRKKSEWEFRALCESATSETQPLFATLTYDNDNLPSQGVVKKHVQDFLKRLRKRLSLCGYDVAGKLRYFCCAEYGSRTQRPHYHLIFWNFPEMETLHKRLEFIEESWQQGFCYVVPVQHGGIGYVMKYMRKSYTPPTGKNNVFFLSSRRNGGIGSKYLDKLIPHFHDNPSCLYVTVTDPYTGAIKTCILPKFFRDKIYPSFARSVDRTTRSVLCRFRENLSICQHLYYELKDYVKVFKPISALSHNLMKKYAKFIMFRICREDTIPSYLKKLSFSFKLKVYERAHRSLFECANYLNLIPEINLAKIENDAKLKIQFQNNLSRYISTLPPVDINASVRSLNNVISLARSGEIL